MAKRVVPMVHVPDVRATLDWYRGIGFDEVTTFGDGDDGLSFAIVSFGTCEVMFNEGGDTSHGMRELIIRDLNRFWITFGEEIDQP